MSSLIKTAKITKDLTWYKKVFLPLMLSGKSHYKKVQDETGIPMAFVACIHAREASSDVGKFQRYLGNGQPLNQKTTIVPKNRGPFSSWHEGAIDILTDKKLHLIKNWDLEKCVYEWEKYNGMGYKNRGKNSPYVWSGTNHGENSGLFIRDGVYDPNAKDQNLGCYAYYELLIEADQDFKIGKEAEMSVSPETKSVLQKIIEFILSLFTNSNEVTYRYITRIPAFGEKNKNVGVIQAALNDFNYGLSVDDDFGPKTKSAISDFQKKNGLAGSGVIGPKTLSFLGIKISEAENVITGNFNEKIWKRAEAEIGVKEIVGSKHNPRILEYHSTTGKFTDDETSWCGSFVEWVITKEGYKGIGSIGAGARNWLKWGVETKNPKKGDVVVFWRESLSSWKGHVAFYSHETATHVYVLGGNQNNQVNVTAYPKSQVLGYRTYAA